MNLLENISTFYSTYYAAGCGYIRVLNQPLDKGLHFRVTSAMLTEL